MPEHLAALLEAAPPQPGHRGISAALLLGASTGAAALEGSAAQDHIVALATAAQHELARTVVTTDSERYR